MVEESRYLCLSNITGSGKHYVDVEFLGDIGDQEPVQRSPGPSRSRVGSRRTILLNLYFKPCGMPLTVSKQAAISILRFSG